jgi:ATP-binding cassette subfamily C protein
MLTAGRALQTSITETLAGRRLVKVFGLERARIDAFVEAIDRSRAAQLAQQRVFAAGNAAIAFAVPAAVALLLWVAVRMMGMELGSAVVFALAFARVGQSVLSLRAARRIVLAALPAEAAIRTLIDEARASAESPASERIALPARRIALDGVSQRYDDGTLALDDVTAEIPVGQITAIVGPSGAGKSTLADLVMGLNAPTAGTVSLDERPLDSAARRAWREQVGYVSQDVFLFDVSLRDNLLAARGGAPDADRVLPWREPCCAARRCSCSTSRRARSTPTPRRTSCAPCCG